MESDKKKNHIRRLYDVAFGADKDWNAWYFDRVYRDDEAMLLAPGGNPVSCLFLRKYRFGFHGADVGLAYIEGAATVAGSRRRGYMTELLGEALGDAYMRGDTFAALIPATRRLFSYYDRFGFATVVYADIERYTSVHRFAAAEGYRIVEPTFRALADLERRRPATVLHSETDFEHILEDTAHDHGVVVAVDDAAGQPAAMAFATPDTDEIHVKELLGDDPAAREMALGAVKDALGNRDVPMAVWCVPTGRPAMLRARAMMRIVSVERALSLLAERYPRLEQVIRVSDRVVPANNGVFVVRDGRCRVMDSTMRHLTLDVTVDVLTRILFSSARIGDIFGIPSVHPLLPLMLD